MVTFEEILGTVIPVGVVIVGLYLLYRPLREPLSGLFGGVWHMLGWIKRKITGEDEYERQMEGLGKTIYYE